MNMQRFFEQIRETHAAKRGAEEMKQDPFDGLVYMADEMRNASDEIVGIMQLIQAARARRDMTVMHEKAVLLQKKVQQLAIMANSMMLTTATHKDRGVK